MNIVGIAEKMGGNYYASTNRITFAVSDLEKFSAEIKKQALLEASLMDVGCTCCRSDEFNEAVDECRAELVKLANEADK